MSKIRASILALGFVEGFDHDGVTVGPFRFPGDIPDNSADQVLDFTAYASSDIDPALLNAGFKAASPELMIGVQAMWVEIDHTNLSIAQIKQIADQIKVHHKPAAGADLYLPLGPGLSTAVDNSSSNDHDGQLVIGNRMRSPVRLRSPLFVDLNTDTFEVVMDKAVDLPAAVPASVWVDGFVVSKGLIKSGDFRRVFKTANEARGYGAIQGGGVNDAMRQG